MRKSRTIYVVTDEYYSGYRIEGAFSTRQLADEYVKKAKLASWSRALDVEVWELDERQDACQFQFWTLYCPCD